MDFLSLRVSSVKLAGLVGFVSVELSYSIYKLINMNRRIHSFFSPKIHRYDIAPQFSSSVCLFEIITDSEAVQRVVHVIVLDQTVFLGQVVHKFSQTTATQRQV